jgi:hypothetical protein
MSYVTVTVEEFRDLISGRFTFFKCIDCDGKGYVSYDGNTGESITPHTDPASICRVGCESCDGLGGNIHWKE